MVTRLGPRAGGKDPTLAFASGPRALQTTIQSQLINFWHPATTALLCRWFYVGILESPQRVTNQPPTARGSGTGPKKKRPGACGRCSTRKVRCDSQAPICGKCQKAEASTSFLPGMVHSSMHVHDVQSAIGSIGHSNHLHQKARVP